LCIALSLLVDISVLSLVGAAAAGIPSSILLCGLARRGAGQPALAGAALASATCFGALALLGVPYLAAIALGGALASLLAAPIAIGAMSAAARLWGGGERRETAAQRLLARLAL